MKEGGKFKSKLDERKNLDNGNLVIGKNTHFYMMYLFIDMKYVREV